MQTQFRNISQCNTLFNLNTDRTTNMVHKSHFFLPLPTFQELSGKPYIQLSQINGWWYLKLGSFSEILYCFTVLPIEQFPEVTLISVAFFLSSHCENLCFCLIIKHFALVGRTKRKKKNFVDRFF